MENQENDDHKNTLFVLVIVFALIFFLVCMIGYLAIKRDQKTVLINYCLQKHGQTTTTLTNAIHLVNNGDIDIIKIDKLYR